MNIFRPGFILVLFFAIPGFSFGQLRNVGIGDISVIELAGPNNTWLGSNGNGIELYNSATQTSDTFNMGNTPQLKSDTITTILYTQTMGEDNVFVGTKNGLACYRGSSWDTIGHLSGRSITGLILTAGDSLWVLTADSGVFIFDSTGQTFLGSYNTGNSPIPTDSISTGQKGNSSCGNYCIATAQSGCFYTTDGTSYSVLDTSKAGKYLVDNRVTAVCLKNDCSARFIGTQGGYSSCPPGLPCTNFTTANGLPENYITAIGEDCKGKVWLGTRDSGIIVYNPRLNATSKFVDVFDSIQRTSYWLVQGAQGLMYGTNTYDGLKNAGMLFYFDPVQTTGGILYTFDTTWNSGHLWNPVGNMIATDTCLYGLTISGGDNYVGTEFNYYLNGNYIVQRCGFHDTIGEFPTGFMQASNGLAYGVTSKGGYGADTFGVLFRFNLNTSKIKTEYSFDSVLNGAHPDGNLTQGATGLIYGSTPVGGLYNKGTLFQFNPVTEAYLKLYDFQGAPDGDHPSGPVIRASDGLLYGTTQFGGTENGGILFAFDTATGTIAKLHEFTAPLDSPTYLYQSANGMFYGIIQGSNGGLFQYNRYDGLFAVLEQFNDTDGIGTVPYPNMAENPQGSVFGRTTQGGSIGLGTIFEFDPRYAEFQTYTTANGLASNQITAIALDPDNCGAPGYIGTADGSIAQIDTSGAVTVLNPTPAGLHNLGAYQTGVYLYPQPASSQFQFVFSSTIASATLYVTDLYGQKLQQYAINNQSSVTADVSRLSSGIYYFYVAASKEVLSSGKISVIR